MRFGGAMLLIVGMLASCADAAARTLTPPATSGSFHDLGTRSAVPPSAPRYAQRQYQYYYGRDGRRYRRQQPTRRAREPASRAPQGVYAAMPVEERIAIQTDLVWTGEHYGVANGKFDKRAIAAVKAFQKRYGRKQTGILNPDERQKLAQEAQARQRRVVWRMVEDHRTGVRLGIPTKLVSAKKTTEAGSRWQSRRGVIRIETFRIDEPGASLATSYARERKNPPQRKIHYAAKRKDFFVISGLQNLKKFYVRVHEKDNELRGMTVLYDQQMDGIMDPVALAMAHTFEPFPDDLDPQVAYASGFVASAAGDIVTDAQVVAECKSLVIPGRGHAEKLAEEDGVALLRVYGARKLTPLPLAGEAKRSGEAVLVGVPDPQTQEGGKAVSTVTARLAPRAGGVSLSPRPAAGFSGAAALDPDGRVIGLVAAQAQRAASAARRTPVRGRAAELIPAAAIRSLLVKHEVAEARGRASLDAAKAGVVRVICVRG